MHDGYIGPGCHVQHSEHGNHCATFEWNMHAEEEQGGNCFYPRSTPFSFDATVFLAFQPPLSPPVDKHRLHAKCLECILFQEPRAPFHVHFFLLLRIPTPPFALSSPSERRLTHHRRSFPSTCCMALARPWHPATRQNPSQANPKPSLHRLNSLLDRPHPREGREGGGFEAGTWGRRGTKREPISFPRWI